MDCHRKGQDGDITRPFYGDHHFPLMLCTVSGDPSGDDLSAFGNEVSKDPRVFIVDIQFLVGAEAADLSSHERFSPPPIGSGPFSFGSLHHHLLLSSLLLKAHLKPQSCGRG